MTPRLSAVLSCHDLPSAELGAARLDGEVFAIDECFSPIDEIEGREHRAMAIRQSFPARLIAERLSAAWVLGATPHPPRRHQFCVPIDSRVRPQVSPRFTVREVVIGEGDMLTLAGQVVTTPLRTIVDLARFSPEFGTAERAAVAMLLYLGGLELRECREQILGRRKLPGKTVTLARLELCETEELAG